MSVERPFEVVDRRFVCIDVDGFVWIKRGAVIAYHGDLRFHLESVLQPEGIHLGNGPARSALKREIVPLSRAEGRGRLYVSNEGQYNQVVRLNGDSLYVVSSHLVAFEPALEHEIVMVGGVGVLAGGLFVVRLSGTGLVAISTHGESLTMNVTEGDPLSTDPTSAIAWSGGLWPELKTDLEMRSLIAHGGGEPVQMRFRGDGYVVVNAKSRSEAMRASLERRLLSKLTAAFV